MKVLYEQMSSYEFVHNSGAHSFLAILYAYLNRNEIKSIFIEKDGWDKNFGKIAYIQGHVLIAITQYILSYKSEDYTRTISYLGSLGHLSLLIYVSWIRHHQELGWLLIAFTIGQIGMVYFYMNHMEPNKVLLKNKSKDLTNKDIFLCTFIVLFSFYAIRTYHEKSMLQWGFMSVAGVYALLSYHYFFAL